MVLYLLISVSFTLCLVSQFAAEMKGREVITMPCTDKAIQGRKGGLAAWHSSGGGEGCSPRG